MYIVTLDLCLYSCCISTHNFHYLDLMVHTSPPSHKSTNIFHVPTYLQSKMGFEIFSPHIYKAVRRGTRAPRLRTIDMKMCCLVGAVTLVKRAIIVFVIACEATMYWQLAVLNGRNSGQELNSTIRGRNQLVTALVTARVQQNSILNLHNFPQSDTTYL
jgi:hypothetical protein